MHKYDIAVFMDGDCVWDSRCQFPDSGCELENAYDAVRIGNNAKETCKLLDCESPALLLDRALYKTSVWLTVLNDCLFAGQEFNKYQSCNIEDIFEEMRILRRFYEQRLKK